MKKTKKVSKSVVKNKKKLKAKTTVENNKKAKTSVKKVAGKVAKKTTNTKSDKKTETKKTQPQKKTDRRTTSLSEKSYKNFRSQVASQEQVPEKEIVTVERRKIVSAKIAEPKKALPKREKVTRRRQIDPTTCERDYTPEEIEFMGALDEYKRQSGRMFPTCSEILEVFRNLGYIKQSSPEESEQIEIQEVILITNETENSISPIDAEESMTSNWTGIPSPLTPSKPAMHEHFGGNSDSREGYTHPFGAHHLDEE